MLFPIKFVRTVQKLLEIARSRFSTSCLLVSLMYTVPSSASSCMASTWSVVSCTDRVRCSLVYFTWARSVLVPYEDAFDRVLPHLRSACSPLWFDSECSRQDIISAQPPCSESRSQHSATTCYIRAWTGFSWLRMRFEVVLCTHDNWLFDSTHDRIFLDRAEHISAFQRWLYSMEMLSLKSDEFHHSKAWICCESYPQKEC